MLHSRGFGHYWKLLLKSLFIRSLNIKPPHSGLAIPVWFCFQIHKYNVFPRLKSVLSAAALTSPLSITGRDISPRFDTWIIYRRVGKQADLEVFVKNFERKQNPCAGWELLISNIKVLLVLLREMHWNLLLESRTQWRRTEWNQQNSRNLNNFHCFFSMAHTNRWCLFLKGVDLSISN